MLPNQNPQVDIVTAIELLKIAEQKAYEISGGKLRVTNPSSAANALLEGGVAAASQVVAKVNNLALTLEEKRLSYFDDSKSEGRVASGTVEFVLDGLYPDATVIPSGFRFFSDNVAFETTSDAIAPSYSGSAIAYARAVEVGENGNLTSSSTIFFESVRRTVSINWQSLPNGGVNAETAEQWRERIYSTLRRRDTIISESDFTQFALNYLGVGSTAFCIGRLSPDKTAYRNGYVAIFGLNADGSSLNDSQILDLQALFNSKSAIASTTVFSIEKIIISVQAIATINKLADPYVVGSAIRQEIYNYFKPGDLIHGESILNKAIEKRIQDVKQVIEGKVLVKLNGFAQPLPLPNTWTIAIAQPQTTYVTLIRNGVEFLT